jgi:hypothetical protein
MTAVTVDVDTLPPTQLLILEVLAARHRLGEHVWPFPTSVAPAVAALNRAGLVDQLNGNQPHTVRAQLTDKGRAAVLFGDYVSPLHTPTERIRALCVAAEAAGTTLLPSQILAALNHKEAS